MFLGFICHLSPQPLLLLLESWRHSLCELHRQRLAPHHNFLFRLIFAQIVINRCGPKFLQHLPGRLSGPFGFFGTTTAVVSVSSAFSVEFTRIMITLQRKETLFTSWLIACCAVCDRRSRPKSLRRIPLPPVSDWPS